MALLLTGTAQAETVHFAGKVETIFTSGNVDAISQYIAEGDTFTGWLEYDPYANGSPRPTTDDVGSWVQYISPFSEFSLTFTSGNSSGFSIGSFDEAASDLQIKNDVVSHGGNPLEDVAAGVISLTQDEFRPGLKKRNFVFRFWDFDATMVDSAALADWDAGRSLSDLDTQSNELAFNSTVTQFSQRAHFIFTEFSSADRIPGDVNLDGVVNIFDINLVSAHWGETGPVGDVNGDTVVNIFDINLISANWTVGGGGTAVPEPSSIVLALLAGAGLAVARFRRR